MEKAWRGSLAALWLAVGCLAGPVGADEEIRPEWMRFDAERRIVQVLLVGASDGSNGTMNFNGHGSGAMTVIVPLGWKVEVEFQNRGLAATPHSLVVIDEVSPLPIEGGTPAFSRALTRALVPGMMAGQTDSFDFVASREGRFLLFCGVTGHGAGGMWDYLVVSREATTPSVQVKSNQ